MSERAPAFVEVDGADVHPHTVDSRAAADLVQTFLLLLSRSAVLRGVPLEVHGLFIEDKCFRIRVDTTEAELMQKAMEVMAALLAGAEQPDAKADADLVRKFSNLVHRLSPDAQVKLGVAGWVQKVVLAEELPPLAPQVTTTLRVQLLRVGVKPATAKFASGSEEDPFSIDVSDDVATELGKRLGQELDLEFTYRRNRLGKIEDAQIIAFHPMEVEGGGEWLRWLDENGRSWDDVPDVLEELGRGDD